MFKVICLLAVIAVVTALPSTINSEQVPPSEGVSGQEEVPSNMQAPGEDIMATSGENAEPIDEQQKADDMDKAETFGFGYRKYIHVYPGYYSHYYPRFYNYGYYPRYYYGHYRHYW